MDPQTPTANRHEDRPGRNDNTSRFRAFSAALAIIMLFITIMESISALDLVARLGLTLLSVAEAFGLRLFFYRAG
jgi:hypothetical protein